jgi:hypothetical protein
LRADSSIAQNLSLRAAAQLAEYCNIRVFAFPDPLVIVLDERPVCSKPTARAPAAGRQRLAISRMRWMTMPLIRATERPVFKRDAVRFLMRDGVDEVPCRVSHRALLSLGSLLGMNDTTLIFAACRERIERAASDKYDRFARHDYEMVIVTMDDL